MLLLKELVMVNKKSFLSAEHFSQIQTIKEECAFLLRNFYKVIFFVSLFETKVFIILPVSTDFCVTLIETIGWGWVPLKF